MPYKHLDPNEIEAGYALLGLRHLSKAPYPGAVEFAKSLHLDFKATTDPMRQQPEIDTAESDDA